MALWVRQAASNRIKQVHDFSAVETALKAGHLSLDDLISNSPDGPWTTIRDTADVRLSLPTTPASTPPRKRTYFILAAATATTIAATLAWAVISRTNAHYAEIRAKRFEITMATADSWINDPSLDADTLAGRLAEVQRTLNEKELQQWQAVRDKANARQAEIIKAQTDAEETQSIWRQITECLDSRPLDTTRLQTLLNTYRSSPATAKKHDTTALARQLNFVTNTSAMRQYWKTRPQQELTEIATDPNKRTDSLRQTTQAWDDKLKEMFTDDRLREAYLSRLFDEIKPTLEEIDNEQRATASKQEEERKFAADVASQLNNAKEIDWKLLDTFPEDYREGQVCFVTASFETSDLVKWNDDEFFLTGWTQRSGPNLAYHSIRGEAPLAFKPEMAKQLITRGITTSMMVRLYGVLRKRTWRYNTLRGTFEDTKLSLSVFKASYATAGGDWIPGPETQPW